MMRLKIAVMRLIGSASLAWVGAHVATSLAAELAWPPAPAQPAIVYVRNVATPGAWGVEAPTLQRLWDVVMGREPDRFVRPTGVAERDGVLYVADPGAAALWIVDRPQNRLTKLTRVGDAQLVSPVAVALGAAGSVYVADSVLAVVYAIDSGGKLIGVAAAQSLARPAGLAYDAAARRLYVADSAEHRIGVFDVRGAMVATIGDRGVREGQFNAPTHLALDRQGTLLVTDALNFRIEAFDREGRFSWTLGKAGDGSGDFAAPKGVAVDGAGRIYVVDALFDTVQIFDRSGALLLAFGGRGRGDGQFWLPGGIFISAQGEIYVADAHNHRVQVFRIVRDASEVVK